MYGAPDRTEYIVLAMKESGYQYQCRNTPYSADKCDLRKLMARIILPVTTMNSYISVDGNFYALSNKSFPPTGGCNMFFACLEGSQYPLLSYF